MGADMKENFIRTRYKELDSMNGQTARSIMVNGKTTVCMEKESR